MIEVGERAPDFSGVDQNGNKISLSDFKGKKVVLYFYPKDNTPGCTAQACNLRDNFDLLWQKGIQVIGVSIDSVESHKRFETKFDLPFPLVADPDKKIVNQYGVWGEKKFMGRTFDGTHRTTFLIDEKGIVQYVITKPNTKEQAEQILVLWKD
ncbi:MULTISPECIES: thioredoxin-dependent thiol peroxidase [Chitinophagaceae]